MRPTNENKKKLNNISEKGINVYTSAKIIKNKENIFFNSNTTNEVVGNVSKRRNYMLKNKVGIIEPKLIFLKDKYALKNHVTIKKKISF